MWRWLLLVRLEQVSARCSGKLGDRTDEQHNLREGAGCPMSSSTTIAHEMPGDDESESSRAWRRAVAAGLTSVACAAMADSLVPLDAGVTPVPPPPWHVAGLPLQKKPFTRFEMVPLDGKRVLRVEADRSYGNLVHPLQSEEPGRYLSWRWRVDLPNEHANLRVTGGDDSAAEVCVMFDLPMNAVPFVDRQLVWLARAHSTELLPTATVCYVWDAHFPIGTVLDNAFTRRIRMIVVRGANTPLRAWRSERRDVRADFLLLFGDEATTVPDIVGVGISADADNTQSRSLAYIADLVLQP
jgi:hypothetical protein